MNSEATRISSFGDISAVSGSKILDPVEQLLHAKVPTLNEMTEAVIFWMHARNGIEEFVQAQQEFQSLTGKVFHDDYFYHQRMSYFLDYFTFQRPIQGSPRVEERGQTPYQSFMKSSYLLQINASEVICRRYKELENFRHSLFQILKIAKNRMVLRDLCTKDKFEIFSSGGIFFQGFATGSILQGFLFLLEGQAHMSHGVLIHPVGVARIVRRSLKVAMKDDATDSLRILARLAKQNLSLIRHRNLDARKIYLQDPR